jgi:hypothetical protein
MTHLVEVGLYMEKKRLRALIIDFRQYAITLLAVSVFFYLGCVLPDQEKKGIYDSVLMIATALFLIGSIICFERSSNYKKQLEKQSEQ